MENENNGDTSFIQCAQYGHQRISKGPERIGNKNTSGDHPNYILIKIGQNTEKSPGDLKKLDVTQTPVEYHQLILVWKTLKGEK